MTELEHAGTTYHLIGTAHVSKASIDEVRAAIATLSPDVVCVELCQTRLDSLEGKRTLRDVKVLSALREGRAMFLLAQVALDVSYGDDDVDTCGLLRSFSVQWQLLEAPAGSRAALKRGLPFALIDREVSITLRRTWANLGIPARAMLAASFAVGALRSGQITEQLVEELKEKRNMSQLMAELATAMPEIKAPMIDERDQYMASKLVEAGAGKRRVLAVVGAAHVAGITAHLGRDIDRTALEQLPRKGGLIARLRRAGDRVFSAA